MVVWLAVSCSTFFVLNDDSLCRVRKDRFAVYIYFA